MHFDIKHISEQVHAVSEPFRRLRTEMQRIIVGQENLLHKMMVGLLANGHMLIEGVPGLAKTTAVSCLAAGINTGFQRIQFTPDLLPADLIGTLVYRPVDGQFIVKKGPIFSHLILADEINRAPAKVQSALLEAMQERQVTIGEETFRLEEPFLVMATQNPIEQEGTYPLPEAQVDRFMLKLTVTYPTKAQEREILDRMSHTTPPGKLSPVMNPADILAARKVVDEIYMDDKIKDYVVDLVTATRDPKAYRVPVEGLIQYGVSPRATIYLTLGAKACAFLAGRGYVVPQDVKDIAPEVLRHRVIISYEAEAEEKTSDDIVRAILDHVPVP
ncbi:MAG: MoxR family ATPase [Phycisphaerae bacterium]|nr:MoxR family ATPase [Phycisphaerae bacterium]NUQ47258.1 MoxR family ATPase [Phycisphaerae bacterium]